MLLSLLLLLLSTEYEPGSIKASNSSSLPSSVMISKISSGLFEQPGDDKWELFGLVVILLSDERLGVYPTIYADSSNIP